MTHLDRKTLLESLAYALKKILLDTLDGLDRSAMESNIDLFMDQEVNDLGNDEILERFYTPENTLRIFTEFLEKSGALEDTSDKILN